jgi:Uma2 family endonuclease
MAVTTTTDAGPYTVESYFDLARSGALDPEDHTELLDGVIVAEPPQEPPHASGTTRVHRAVEAALAGRAVVRVQQPFIADSHSAPEPDVAVVPGVVGDYDERHPDQALLIVEVADASLPEDRLSNARIYAGAGVVECWIVNLRERHLEVFLRPDRRRRVYTQATVRGRGETICPAAFPDARIAVDDLLPQARSACA